MQIGRVGSMHLCEFGILGRGTSHGVVSDITWKKFHPVIISKMSYYERWFHVHEQKALETGIVTRTELETSTANLDNVVPELERHPDSWRGSRRLNEELSLKFCKNQTGKG